MTSLVSPLTRVTKAAVSGADFTALESSVAANTSKPTATAVDGQIDTKNAAQLLQINLDYTDRATTYNVSQVDGLVASRTTPADVQTALNTRFLAQDISNFVVFQDRSTGLTAAAAASTYAPQSGVYTKSEVDSTNSTTTALIAQASTNIADLELGNLSGLNVYNAAASGSNTLEIRCRPDASANQASLQIVHDHTTSGSRAKLGFWTRRSLVAHPQRQRRR